MTRREIGIDFEGIDEPAGHVAGNILGLNIELPKDTALTLVPKGDETLFFNDLEEAEEAAKRSAVALQSNSIRLARIFDAVRLQQLWKGEYDPDTGERYTSFDNYLANAARRLSNIVGAARSTIWSKLLAFSVYERQLGYDESFMEEMGSHADRLLLAAHVNPKGQQLIPNDKPTPQGGHRLGRERFAELVQEIAAKVEDGRRPGGIPWRIEDTDARVKEVLGYKEDEKVSFLYRVTQLGGASYRIEEIRAMVGVSVYKAGDEIDIDHLRLLGKGAIVEGVPEGWR